MSLALDKVDIKWWKRNIFFSADQPAYIVLRTNKNIMGDDEPVKLVCYDKTQPTIIHIDDLASGTTRTSGIIQLWATNPRPLPSSMTQYAVVCEVHSSTATSTTPDLRRRFELPYLYGPKRRMINFVDENNNPISLNYCISTLGGAQYQWEFFECDRFTGFGDPGGPLVFEIWGTDITTGKKKYYLIGQDTDLPVSTTDISVKLTPKDKHYVQIKYALNSPALDLLFNNNYLGGAIASFVNANLQFLTSVSGWLAHLISNKMGIGLTIVGAKAYVENNTLKIEVIYENDISPVLIALIAIGGSFIGGLLVGSLMSGAIERIAYYGAQITYQVTARDVNSQRAQLATKIIESCTSQAGVDQTCVSNLSGQLLGAVAIPSAPEPPRVERITPAILGAIGGLVVGLLLRRRP